MSHSFFFSNSFKRSLKLLDRKYPHVKDDVRVALRALEQPPQIGTVIPASGGIRKMRVRNSDAARGKSGGYRLLYVIRADRDLICLLLVYSKSDQSDVDRTELIDLLNSLRQDLGEKPVREEREEYLIDPNIASLQSNPELAD